MRQPTRSPIILAAALAFFMTPVAALACSCASAPGCHPSFYGGHVFLAEVLKVRMVLDPTGPNVGFRHKIVHLRVVESFYGRERPGEELDIYTGVGGGDCGYNFVEARRYLVDAYEANKPDAALGVGICGRTTAEDQAAILLKELHTRAANRSVPDLDGQVRTRNLYDEAEKSVPLSGVPVTLTAADGSLFYQTTGSDGIYEFPVLPPGAYKADFALPPGRKALQLGWKDPVTVTIPDNHGVGAGCHQDIDAAPSGSIAGKVTTADGKATAGNITLTPAGSSTPIHNAFQSWNTDTGEYKLSFVKDGEYELALFSAGKRRLIKSVTVRNGEGITGVDFQLTITNP